MVTADLTRAERRRGEALSICVEGEIGRRPFLRRNGGGGRKVVSPETGKGGVATGDGFVSEQQFRTRDM